MMNKLKISKAFLLTVSLVVVLGAAALGTVAYIIDVTEPVENVFNPAKVPIEVTDKISDGVKSDVTITNKGNVPAYIRVAIVANWFNSDGKIVAPCDLSDIDASKWGTNWVKHGAYFYYTLPVEPTKTAENKFEFNSTELKYEDAHLEMTIIAQAVQSTPPEAVEEAWGGVSVSNDGTLIVGGGSQ